MGLTVLPPDLNVSDWASIGDGHTIRLGLMHVKGLQRALVDRCMAEREQHGRYRSFGDWLHRVRPEIEQGRVLIQAGGCTSLAEELTQPGLMWGVLASESSRQDRPASLFDAPERRKLGPLPIPEEYDQAELIEDEIRAFGFSVTLPFARSVHG
jgi:DNA polymerase III alpha subunit